jgi:hypothetical protein
LLKEFSQAFTTEIGRMTVTVRSDSLPWRSWPCPEILHGVGVDYFLVEKAQVASNETLLL